MRESRPFSAVTLLAVVFSCGLLAPVSPGSGATAATHAPVDQTWRSGAVQPRKQPLAVGLAACARVLLRGGAPAGEGRERGRSGGPAGEDSAAFGLEADTLALFGQEVSAQRAFPTGRVRRALPAC
jgi:hypothetical protein